MHSVVWPAFTDLMTVIAITGMVAASALAKQVRDLRVQIEPPYALMKKLNEAEHDTSQLKGMAEAIKEAAAVVDDFAGSHSGLTRGSDQSLQFGEDLVQFAKDEATPMWIGDGQLRMRSFCESLSANLALPFGGHGVRRDYFQVQVEGHTDSQGCNGRQDCNWTISARRAAGFRILMDDPEVCPGGSNWSIVPMGLGGTRSVGDRPAVNRRIEVRLVPDYAAIIGNRVDSAGVRLPDNVAEPQIESRED